MTWAILTLVVLATFLVVFIPAYLIQPFAPQTQKAIEVSYLLKTWSSVITVLLALVAVAAAVFIWTRSRRWHGKAALILPLA